jgi:hypothetical protein
VSFPAAAVAAAAAVLQVKAAGKPGTGFSLGGLLNKE